MEHELFRPVELEMFVRESQLSSALKFLKHILVAVPKRSSKISSLFRAQLNDRRDCVAAIVILIQFVCERYCR